MAAPALFGFQISVATVRLGTSGWLGLGLGLTFGLVSGLPFGLVSGLTLGIELGFDAMMSSAVIVEADEPELLKGSELLELGSDSWFDGPDSDSVDLGVGLEQGLPCIGLWLGA